jgi:hypothetical protein
MDIRGGSIMAKELTSVDISNAPDLLHLVEEVRRTGQPRLLRRDSEDLAVLSPVTTIRKRRRKRETTAADREAFLSSAGGWTGNVDVDAFLKENYESRDHSSRPPIEL